MNILSDSETRRAPVAEVLHAPASVTNQAETLCVQLLRSSEASESESSETDAKVYGVSFRRLTQGEWCVVNRWLHKQTRLDQATFLFRCVRHEVPLRYFDTLTLGNILLDYGVGATAPCEHIWRHVLRKHATVHATLLSRAAEATLPRASFDRLIRLLLHAMAHVMLRDHLVITPSQVVMFYERLQFALLRVSDRGRHDETHGVSGEDSASDRFTHFIVTIAEAFNEVLQLKGARASVGAASRRYNPYRVLRLRKVHSIYITTVFQSLSARGQFVHMDKVFQFNLSTLAPLMRSWLPNVDTQDVAHVWHRCPHIRAFCVDVTVRWQTVLRRNDALWARCRANASPVLLAVHDCGFAAIVPLVYTHVRRTLLEDGCTGELDPSDVSRRTLMKRGTAAIAALLHDQTTGTQRRLVQAMILHVCDANKACRRHAIGIACHEASADQADQTADAAFSSLSPSQEDIDLEEVRRRLLHECDRIDEDVGSHAPEGEAEAVADGPATDSPPSLHATDFAPSTFALLRVVRTFLRRYMRTVIRVTRAAESTLRYYQLTGVHSLAVFSCIHCFRKVNARVMRRWLRVHSGLPLGVFVELLTRSQRRLALVHRSDRNVILNHPSTMSICQALTHVDRVVAHFLKQPIDLIDDPKGRLDLCNALLRQLAAFLDTYEELIAICKMRALRHFVQCVLVLVHMHCDTRRVVVRTNTAADDASHTCEHEASGGYTVTTTGVAPVESMASTDVTAPPPLCSICYETCTDTMQQLACGHTFHTECIFQATQLSSSWHTHTIHLGKCPYCMQHIQMNMADGPVHVLDAANPLMPVDRRALQMVQTWWMVDGAMDDAVPFGDADEVETSTEEEDGEDDEGEYNIDGVNASSEP